MVAVQQDQNAPLCRGRHDRVQLGARGQALQGLVAAAQVGWFHGVQFLHQLDGEGQAQGVEAVGRHKVHDVGQRAAPQAVQDAVGGLQAKPVDAFFFRARKKKRGKRDRVSSKG